MANFLQQIKLDGELYDLHDSEFIIDTRTASGAALTGISKAPALFDGMQITFWLSYAAASNATLNLTLADGSTTGAIPCYYSGTTRLGTHYAAGNAVRFTYRENVTIGSTTIAKGWWSDANYDSDTKVTQNAAITTAGEYPVILANGTGTGVVTSSVNKTSTLKYNPSTNVLTSGTFSGSGASLTNLNASNISSGTINSARLPDLSNTYITTSLIGEANGIAELDENGRVPSSQLPSYVDDVVTGYYNPSDELFYEERTFIHKISGESNKIYIDLDSNKTYRWSGLTTFIEISASLALGETSSTAYRGDRGATAYAHATDSGRLTTAASSGLYKVSVTAQGHVGSATAVTKSDITALGIPGENTDTKVTQNATTTANNSYRVLLSNSATNNAETAAVNKAAALYYNPSIETLYSSHIYTDTKYLYRQTQTNGIPDITVKPQISTTRANRLAFLPADQIIIEKTTDGGTTWEDAGVSDAHKLMLFSETRAAGIYLPLLNGVKNINCGLRITITGMKYNVPEGTPETEKYNYWNSTYVKSTERYCQLSELYFFVSSNTDGISLKVERATGANSTTWVSAYDSGSTFALTGWSGSDYVRFTEGTFGGGVNQTSNYWNCRLTFFTRNNTGGTTLSTSSTTAAQFLQEIRGYGTNVWTYSNNYMKDDHLYTWNHTKQVMFPSTVTASGFYGSGANLTSLNASNISSGTLSTARLPNAYGDTKNPYAAKVANTVLAGPTSGNNADPTFRQLVAADIPLLTKSKISDFPTEMTPTSHTHGNIKNGGNLSGNAALATIAADDRLVIADNSEGDLIAKSSIKFGSDSNKYLSNSGTWEDVETIIYITDHQGESGWSGDRYTLDAPYNDKTTWDAFTEELATTDIGARTAFCIQRQDNTTTVYYSLVYNKDAYGSAYPGYDMIFATAPKLEYGEDNLYHFAIPYLGIILDTNAVESTVNYSISENFYYIDEVLQKSISDNKNYRVLLSGHANDYSHTYYVNKASSLTYNPSTQLLTAGSFSGSGANITSLNASNLSSGTVPAARMPDLSSTYIPTSQKGAASGVATLDSNSKVPIVQSNYLFGKCTTGGSTAAKVASITGYSETNIANMEGVTVFIAFKNASTASNPTLNISSAGAHPIVIGTYDDPYVIGKFSNGLHAFTLIKASDNNYYWWVNEGRDTVPEAPVNTNKYLLNVDSTGSVSWSSYTPVTAPTTGTLSLDTSGWSGNGPYSHSVTISGTTANSKIDLQPDSTVLAQMTTDGTTALYIENNNGTLTAWVMGAKPTAALSIQYTRTEVA